ADNARRFLGRYGNPFAANGTDSNGRAAIEWGVYGVPETFVIGRDGRIAHKLIGPITPDNLDTALKPAIQQALANRKLPLLRLLRRGVSRQQRILQRGEQEGQRDHAEHLEAHPHVGRLRAPDDLVEDCERKEEQRPAQGQLAPTLLGEMEDGIEHHPKQRLAESEPAEQHGPEQQIDDGGLELDEELVVQDQRERPKHQHDDRGDERHDRQVPRQRVRHRERDHHSDHEHCGRDEDAGALSRGNVRGQYGRDQRQEQRGPRAGEGETQQRPELEHELEEGVELRFFRGHGRCLAWPIANCHLVGGTFMVARARHDFHSIPAIARAKSFAENGARSSIPSPTPMKCTGRPYFAAMATKMPPRAVPSSLVMTRPLTPARSRNTSTWDSAFCPTVASSTNRTACGATGSTFFITRPIFWGSSINPALFCRRPAVAPSSTSTSSPRACVSASKARPAASAPGARAITDAPLRPPQMLSWSMAAARKVSPAASITERPSARNLEASLPMVVVLPEPLTPTTSTTKGFASPIGSGLATGVRTFSTSAATTAFTSSAVIDLS